MFNNWGFSGNPYYSNELIKEELLTTLFVGRRKERRKFISTLNSGIGAVCIEGKDFGIGKSTFFNRVALEVEKVREDFIVAKKIDFVSSTSPRDLLLDIMHRMVEAVERPGVVPKDVRNEVHKITQIRGVEKGREISVSLPSILRGSRHKSETQKERENITTGIIGSKILEIDRKVFDKAGKRFLISIENLESSKIRSESIKEGIESLRDLTFLNSLYFFIGDLGLRRTLSESGRLRSLAGNSIVIPPLNLHEFQNAVNIRLDHFSIKNKKKIEPIFPLDDDVVKYIHLKSKGDIRWAFNFLHRIFQGMVDDGHSVRVHNLADVEIIMVERAKETYEGLTRPLQKIIRGISRCGPSGPSSSSLIKETGFKTSYLNRNLNSEKIKSSPEILKRSREDRKAIYSLGYEMEMLKEYKII